MRPVLQFVCPRCLANMGEPCSRVRKVRRVPLETVLNPHSERHAVQKAHEQPDLFGAWLDTVRKPAYMGVIERKTLESVT